MTATCQQKVMNAGFTIIRADDQPSFRIKYKNKQVREWKTLEKDFKSVSARDKKIKDLLSSSQFIIQD